MSSLDRRLFLKSSAALGATLASFEAESARAARLEETTETKNAGTISANETLRVAVVGVRSRGKSHVDGFLGDPRTRIVTICDADENVIGPAMKRVEERQGDRPQFVQDIRKVLDDKEIDIVAIATPNHWHALMTIWACQAEKDVYVEKPVSHNVREGRAMVEAARKYDRIIQTGTQCRSASGLQDAIAFLRDGGIGDLVMAKGLCYKPRGSIGHQNFTSIPKGLDYDLWTGPAEFQKPGDPTTYNPNILHYNWHWVWNTGNGDLGNQGIHQMDLARWGLNVNGFPNTVQSFGGRLGYEDDGQTPNTQTVALEFDNCLLQFEVRGLITNDELNVKVGDIFYGTEGVLAITSYSNWQSYMGPKLEKGPGGSGGGNHFANFLDAVQSRNSELLNADIEEGHLSSAFCHLGNIAYRLGRKLTIDPATESFVDAPDANAMLTRSYRAPYQAPEFGLVAEPTVIGARS